MPALVNHSKKVATDESNHFVVPSQLNTLNQKMCLQPMMWDQTLAAWAMKTVVCQCRMVSCIKTPKCETSDKDSHFAALSMTNLNGELVFVVAIFDSAQVKS